MLDLFDLGILVSQANYLTFVAASLTAIELHGWADPKQASQTRYPSVIRPG
ncbi:hypothetical protein ACF1BQ_043890 [Bradyrhizobium sp. RDT10]